MSLTHEDVKKILAILDEAECEEVRLEFGDLKLHLRRRGGSLDFGQVKHGESTGGGPTRGERAGDTVAPAAPAAPGPADGEAIPEGVVAVAAPMLGTFYRAASPGERAFVEQGDRVAPDDTVCLVEVMKLFNSVKAGTAGTVEKILVENGTLVEYRQPLMLIRKESA